jgi:hypothetical protein
MIKFFTKKNAKIIIGFLAVTLLAFSSAFSQGGRGPGPGRGGDRGPGGWEGRGARLDFHGGRFFHHGWFGFGAPIAIPPIGAIISGLPDGYISIVIGDVPYYYYGGVYFRPCNYGFVVVDKPIVVSTSVSTKTNPDSETQTKTNNETDAVKTSDTQTKSIDETSAPKDVSMNETNNTESLSESAAAQSNISSEDTVTINIPSSNGYIPVKLVKKSKGYVGPQGEFYPRHPTIAQLKALYGN